MRPLKPLGEQSVVITGASRGIGRAAALLIASRGARVALAARDAEALEDLATIIRTQGGRAVAIPTDVSNPAQVRELAQRAADALGGIDTWINNAAVTVYGRFEQIPEDEFRRVADVNFMGQVNGARAALPFLREQGVGALIFVGSVLSDRGVPMQSPYVASKHAIKGFAEALRVELALEESQLQVTLVKPSSINTPLFDEAATHTGYRPRPVPPVYQPNVAADVIAHCCEHRERDIIIGGGGTLLAGLEAFAGPLLDWYFTRTSPSNQQTKEPKGEDAPNNLQRPLPYLREAEGNFPGRSFSVYTWLRMRPQVLAGAGAAAVGAFGVRRMLRRNGHSHNGHDGDAARGGADD